MFYQFTTAPTFPNLYTACTVNNINLIITLNKEKKDWTKRYHKIIWELEMMEDIQLQTQSLVKLADIANNQLVDIKTVLL